MGGGARGRGERGGEGEGRRGKVGGRSVVHRQDGDLYTLLSVGYYYPVV